MKRVHVLISGVVQGVFFRSNTFKRAKKLGLKGFVRNTPDGRVEAVFEGDEKAVEEILKFCNRGPLGASVENVEVTEEKFKNEFSDFEIAY
jgi:acylphosphatase